MGGGKLDMKVTPTNVYKHLTVFYITLHYKKVNLHVQVLAIPVATRREVLYKAYFKNPRGGGDQWEATFTQEKNVGRIRTIEGGSITRQYGKTEQAEGMMYSPDCTM